MIVAGVVPNGIPDEGEAPRQWNWLGVALARTCEWFVLVLGGQSSLLSLGTDEQRI